MLLLEWVNKHYKSLCTEGNEVWYPGSQSNAPPRYQISLLPVNNNNNNYYYYYYYYYKVWDMRTKACVHTLGGHTNTVADLFTQAPDPQVSFTKYWVTLDNILYHI